MTLLHHHKEQTSRNGFGRNLVAEKQQRRNSFRGPDIRLETREYPEIEPGIYVADPKSGNAGKGYFDVRRIGENGKRFKTLRLREDFFGSLMAHAEIAEMLSFDPSVDASMRDRYADTAADVAAVVYRNALPEVAEKASPWKQALSTLERKS